MSDVVPLYGFGGGGSALNLSVVGNPKPASAKENTIWLNTDTPIPNWVFSPSEPRSAKTGTVWIIAGSTGNIFFNALKKNSIMVYPASAKQYVGGAWESVPAQIYQKGKWIDWEIFFYNAGDTFPSVTGDYYGNAVDTSFGTGSVEFLADKISLHCKGGAQAVVRTQNALDLSAVSKLQLKIHVNVVSDYNNKASLHFCVTENPIRELSQVLETDFKEIKSYAPGTNEEAVVELNVSGDSVSRYIFVALQTTQRAVEAYCDILEIKGQSIGGTPSDDDDCEITVTDDGNGNVFLGGVSLADDGSGNITLG